MLYKQLMDPKGYSSPDVANAPRLPAWEKCCSWPQLIAAMPQLLAYHDQYAMSITGGNMDNAIEVED